MSAKPAEIPPARFEKDDRVKVVVANAPPGWDQGVIVRSVYSRNPFRNGVMLWAYKVALDGLGGKTAWLGEEFLEPLSSPDPSP
jgi:hypothetical protein